jgi:hypothetical protein
MGGEKEFETAQRTPDGQIIGAVRIHLNAGEVHFHDDANGKRKVAMPVATWMGAWQDIQKRLGKKWQYFDPVNQTMLVVRVKAKKAKAKGDSASVDCTLRIEPAIATPDFAAVQKFTFR